MNANELLAHVKIASPCSARWEDMSGDDRSRFCAHCRKNVFNLSSLTANEAAALVREKQGNLCGRFYQRADGTMLTADCPVGAARVWQRVRRLAAALSALIVVSLTLAFTSSQSKEASSRRSRARAYQAWDDAILAAKNWLNPPPKTPLFLGKVMMGGICAPPRLTNAPPTLLPAPKR